MAPASSKQSRIRFCIGESLLGVITGEVSVGKTVAVRAATSQLDAAAHHKRTLSPAEEHERRRRVFVIIDEAHLFGARSTRRAKAADQR